VSQTIADFEQSLFGEPEDDTNVLPEEPEWLTGFRNLKVCDPPRVKGIICSTIDDARLLIAQKMDEYMQIPDPTYVLVIKAPPGLGKTHSAVYQAEKLAKNGWNVLYCGPRHDFLDDIMVEAQDKNIWFHWLPRQEGNDAANKVETCRYKQQIDLWLKRGYKGINFCSNVCGWAYVNNDCPYHAQKRLVEGRIVFGQHLHTTVGHPLNFNVLIIDECPIAAFLYPWSIPAKFILPADMDESKELTSILREMTYLAQTPDLFEKANLHKCNGLGLLQALGGADRLHRAIEEFNLNPGAVLMEPEIHQQDEVYDKPYGHLGALIPLLAIEETAARKGIDYVHRIRLDRDSRGNPQLTLLLRRDLNTEMPKHIICLDATANADLYHQLFHRPIEVIEPVLENKGHIFLAWERANGMGVLREENQDKRPLMTDRLVQQIEEVAQRYGRVGIITHKKLEDRLASIKNAEIGHFYAERGTNRFTDVDALIVAGTPMPSHDDIERIAAMLLPQRLRSFRRENSYLLPWSTRDVPYNYVDVDGRGRAYPTGGFWGEPDLQPILWQLREAEILQAAHRARPLLKSPDIWLLTNIPIQELPIEALKSTADIFRAPIGVDPYKWSSVLEVANQFHVEGKPLYSDDLMDALQISRPTARQHLRILLQTLPDQWCEPNGEVILPNRKNGRPAFGIMPK
jgi:hypothetical protein